MAETTESPEQHPERPMLTVVNPDATPEEIAALVAVFSALGGGAPDRTPRPAPEWSRPARRLRQPLAHGAGGWRSSGLPR